MSRGRELGAPTRGAYIASALLHAGLAAAIFFAFRSPPSSPPLPPMYHVELIAAPPGERAIGEVKTAAPTPSKPVTSPRPSETTVKTLPTPKTPPPDNPVRRATPDVAVPKKQEISNAPRAGGGPIGGKGTDVANVHSEGIEFPFPGYLNNIVRQIALNFHPRDPRSRLRSEVTFLIHRDGTVSDFKFLKRSGNTIFDLEAQGAVEAAAAAHSFGPLPAAFPDDVLPVYFSFDPDFLK